MSEQFLSAAAITDRIMARIRPFVLAEVKAAISKPSEALKGKILINGTVTRIINQVCKEHKLTWAAIAGPRQDHACAHPRQELMYRLFYEADLGYSGIARLLNKKSHETVMHGVKAHSRRLEEKELEQA